MSSTTVAVGSLEGLRSVLMDGSLLGLDAGADVVVVPTAAAFIGVAEAAWAVAEVCEPFDLRVEALMVADRASAGEPYFAERLASADLACSVTARPCTREQSGGRRRWARGSIRRADCSRSGQWRRCSERS
jgi:hypothetical protein